MNPILNFRGPAVIESAANSLDNHETILSAVGNDKSGTRKSASVPAVQRKLSEEKDETIRRKEKNGACSAVTNNFQASIEASKNSGSPLEPQIKNTMSVRFGTDFSDVKVYNNSRSHNLADQINAKAFTTGKDIYFNEGEYAPNTKSGKHLLAHELTHTIQQNSAAETIQKKPKKQPRKDLQVKGVLDIAAQKMDKVYFKESSSSIDFLQELKIASLMFEPNPPKEIFLYGYASDEGTEGANKKLIAKRLGAVKKLIEHFGKSKVKIHVESRPKESTNSYKYREFRAVQFSTVPIAATNGVRNTKDRNCTKTEKAEIIARRGDAVKDVENALQLVEIYYYAPKRYPRIGGLIDFYFGGHSDVVIANLLQAFKQMKSNLPTLKGDVILRCAGVEHAFCNKTYALAGKQTDILFCPKFFNAKEITFKNRILIHELGHFIPKHLRDYGYAHSRVFRFTSPAEALKNSDSYTMLINDINKHKIISKKNTLRDPVGDVVKGCGKKKQPIVEEALSRAERLNSLAAAGMKQTYSKPQHLAAMTPSLRKEFGKINKYSLAALYDRSNKLKSVYRGRKFTLNCLPKDNLFCGKKAMVNLNSKHEIDVCPSFFKLSKSDQIITIGAEVTKFVPEIQDKFRKSYVRIGQHYKKEFWGL